MPLPKSIGIKLYDDSFVPVLTVGENILKKVTLTTVRNNQKKAIIELYEGSHEKCINNEYLGKLTLDLSRETVKGSPAFEVHLRLGDDGMLYAKAWDIDTGKESEIKIEHYSETKRIFPETLSDEETHTLDMQSQENIASYSEDYVEEFREHKKKPPLLLIILIAVLLILLIIGAFFGIKAFLNRDQDKTAPRTETSSQVSEAEKLKQAEQARLKAEQERLEQEELARKKAQLEREKQAKAEQERLKQEEEARKKAAQEKQQKISGMKKADGKRHFIRWGDNLWFICKRYYKDPWYYPSLAEYNEITNPRLIYAGTYLIIPDKSKLSRWDFSQ